jgi:predicted nucleic acid-binding protein
LIIVSDTSVISGLLVIGRLDLLNQIYGRVIIPRIVLEELLALEDYGYDLKEIHDALWLEITDPTNRELEKGLNKYLDKGESAAIVLAQELNPNYLAIDEKRGREVAESMGIPIIGLVGILIVAKEEGIIKKVKPILDELIEKAGFRIGKKFYASILEEINE